MLMHIFSKKTFFTKVRKDYYTFYVTVNDVCDYNPPVFLTAILSNFRTPLIGDLVIIGFRKEQYVFSINEIVENFTNKRLYKCKIAFIGMRDDVREWLDKLF